MSSARRRPLAAASLAALMTLALGGCGTGFNAQTNQVYQPAVGANGRGDVDSLNTLLVANTDGSATLSASLHNNLDQDQSLSSVTITTLAGDELVVRSPKIALPLPAGQLETLGVADAAGIYTVTQDAPSGEYVKITYTFSDAGPLTVEAPVVARTGEYATVVGGDGQSPSDVSGEGETEAEPEGE